MQKKSRQSERCAEYYRKNREKIRARSAAWYKANKERAREMHAKYRDKNKKKRLIGHYAWRKRNMDKHRGYCAKYKISFPEKTRAAHRLRAYGINSAQVNEMLEVQKNLCALCFESFADWKGSRPDS
jgi:hypothetical protein